MSTLVVIGYNEIHKAEEVRLTLVKLQRDYLIDLEDAVAVTKDAKGKIKLHQTVNLTAAGAPAGILGNADRTDVPESAAGPRGRCVGGRGVRSTGRSGDQRSVHEGSCRDLDPEQFGAVRPRPQIHAGQSARGGERHGWHDPQTRSRTRTRPSSRPPSARRRLSRLEATRFFSNRGSVSRMSETRGLSPQEAACDFTSERTKARPNPTKATPMKLIRHLIY